MSKIQGNAYEIKATKIGDCSLDNSRAVTDSTIAAQICRQAYTITDTDLLVRESCFAIYLNRANKVLGFFKVSEGGTTQTVVDTKLIAKVALDVLASSVILCHNHPSGNQNPGATDKAMTRKLKDALGLLDIVLLDHIILTEDGYYSFIDSQPLI